VSNIAAGDATEISYSIKNEAVAALGTLGYNSKTAETVVREILRENPDCTIEELIKKALGFLNK